MESMSYTNIQISADSDAEEIAPFAMAVHELLGLPVTMRTLHKKGVRIEKENPDNNYIGPVLIGSKRIKPFEKYLQAVNIQVYRGRCACKK
jgi:hypothetical protein